jgi:hypothetical protein
VDSSGQPGLPKILQADPTMSDPDYARILTLTIAQPTLGWLGGPHNFTITNPDAQRAVWPFQIFRVDAILIDTARGTITITGDCLDSPLTITCAVGAGAPTTTVRTNDGKIAKQYVGTVVGVVARDAVVVTVADSSGMTVVKTVIAT